MREPVAVMSLAYMTGLLCKGVQSDWLSPETQAFWKARFQL